MFFGKHNKIGITETGIEIQSVNEDRPEFKRVYIAHLNNEVTIKVEMYTPSFGGRYNSGELTQRNGNWVLFDPYKVAEKILDPILVPIIQKYVDEIFARDRDFVKSNPNQFYDQNGDRWIKQ